MKRGRRSPRNMIREKKGGKGKGLSSRGARLGKSLTNEVMALENVRGRGKRAMLTIMAIEKERE